MDAKKAAKATGRTIGFVAFGGAWWSMKMSASLLRKEFARTGENAKVLGEMAKEAKEKFAAARNKKVPDVESFDAAAQAAAEKGITIADVYRHYLTRKRIALVMGAAFLCIGAAGLALGAVLGLLPLVAGTGFCLEIAWLAEYRLWQVRNRRLAANEHASVRDFACSPGAWKGALRLELGAYVAPAMRPYRRWLVGKRLALCVAIGAGLVALARHSAPAGCVLAAAGGLLAALLLELRLSSLRRGLGLPHPTLAPFRFEVGAGYERGEA